MSLSEASDTKRQSNELSYYSHGCPGGLEILDDGAGEGHLRQLAEEFKLFYESKSVYFQTRSHNNTPMAAAYISGLFQCDRSNMERMEEVIPAVAYENLQHFVSECHWDRDGLMQDIALQADTLLGGHEDSILIIDPTSFPKKGTHSVGVARQWSGRLGKQANCQLGVFAMLCCKRFAVPVDFRLYLPEEWTDDPARCRKAHVPEAAMTYRKTFQLALDMIANQRELGIGYEWVVADCEFNPYEFCGALDDADDQFIVELDTRRKVLFEKAGEDFTESFFREHNQNIEAYKDGLSDDDWTQIELRHGEKGPITVKAHRRTVWVWDYFHNCPRHWQLLIVERADGDIKYALSNAPSETPLHTLVRIHGQRFRIERAFQDAKSEVGMAEYQLRGWLGWHNHMSLCCLALLFLLKVRLIQQHEYPLLSARDIRRLLEHFLPKRSIETDDVIAEIRRRHTRRQAAMDSRERKRSQAQEAEP